MRYRRSTDEEAKRSGIKIEKNWACCMEMALERWSCRESSVVSVDKNLV